MEMPPTFPYDALFALRGIMKFIESDKNILTVPKYENCFVYFLLKDEEVVYVGQTRNGLSRPLSHHDKDYNEIKILYCESADLDLLEDSFIQKYKPKYNRQSNYAIRWSLLRVRNCIRNQTEHKNCTIPQLKKILKLLNIKPEKDHYNGKETISFDEYKHVMEHLRNGVNNG